MPNTYLDVYDFTRSTSGLEFQSLLGNQARFTTAQTAAATSLSGIPATGVGSVTVALNQFDRITIFDGLNTEIVQVGAAGAAVGATSIPLLSGTSLAFNHAVGVAWCSDGVAGSLADQIVIASAWMEQYCYQPLLTTTWTNEALTMPSLRASIDNQGNLTFRPRHWPITAITGLKVVYTQSLATTYDATQVLIDGDHRLCSVPNLIQFPAQQSSNSIPPPPARNQYAQLQLSYTSGYAYTALPPELKEAGVLVTSDQLAKRHNPVGAPDIADGAIRISSIIRGEKSGDSLLIVRAKHILSRYNVEFT